MSLKISSLPILSHQTGGVKKGERVLLTAARGLGKSTFLKNFVDNKISWKKARFLFPKQSCISGKLIFSGWKIKREVNYIPTSYYHSKTVYMSDQEFTICALKNQLNEDLFE